MNEIFVIHVDDKPVTTQMILKAQYPGNTQPGWPPKRRTRKAYFHRGHAEKALQQLPKSLRDKAKIVKYIPEE